MRQDPFIGPVILFGVINFGASFLIRFARKLAANTDTINTTQVFTLERQPQLAMSSMPTAKQLIWYWEARSCKTLERIRVLSIAYSFSC